MRNRELHRALRDFALESAALLTTAVNGGAELPYDVSEEPGTGPILYRYRPLTAEFIGARWDALRALPSFEPAGSALGAGAEPYLRVRGLPAGSDAEPALRAMLERLYEDATGFEFPEERFEQVYAELERTLYETTMRASVVVPVHGVETEDERIDLGGGLTLAHGNLVDAPAEAVWPVGRAEREQATGPNVVCALERDVETGTALPASEARVRFRRLLTAMRLLKPGRVAFGSLGWGRADEGLWQPIGLAFGGPGRGEQWVLELGQGGELAELFELLGSTRLPARIEWALGRFEMGCERTSAAEALSDYLLAVRALLDSGDDAGRASLGLRLAALCAEEEHRKAVRARLETAFAIERRTMTGAGFELELGAAEADLEAIVDELEAHVRALLRDVVCGYLAPDLRSAADDILLASSDPIEIGARDLRREPDCESDPEPEPEPEERDRRVARGARMRIVDGPGTAADPRSSAWAAPATPGPRTQRNPGLFSRTEPPEDEEAAVGAGVDLGHTASSDWDEDPDSYSAPV